MRTFSNGIGRSDVPGAITAARGATSNSSSPPSGAHDNPVHGRLLFLTMCLVGQLVDVQLKDGSVYSGIFHTANVDKDSSVMLEMAKQDVLVDFTVEEQRRIMKHNIRNIADVDHRKSALTDSLVAAAGIIAKDAVGTVRMTDTRQDEAERGITIKFFKGERDGNKYLINLHVDFSFEVTAALRITDGALVVDCIEGVCVQTVTVLMQALIERIRPEAVCDRCFVELKVEGEEVYQGFLPVIQNAMATDEVKVETLMKKVVMQSWLPASDGLLEKMVLQLPSPLENLYEGPTDDKYATAIRNCDPDGPLMLYVPRLIPGSDKGRFFAFGRVFSGKVASGAKVQIYVPREKRDLYTKSVRRTVVWMGNKQDSVPCSNTIAMVGLDQFITKTSTLTDVRETEAFPIGAMKFTVLRGGPVALKSDPVVLSIAESGEHNIAGAGELHLEICLRDEFIRQSDRAMSFWEMVLERSRQVTSKSPNKHNRFYFEARPPEEKLPEAIDEEKVSMRDDPKVRSKILSEKFGWDIVKKIWAFGPESTGPNMVVDVESVCSAFQWASKIAEVNMRAICFEVDVDVVLHTYALHTGGARIIATARRTIYGAQLPGDSRLLEQPVYLVGIQALEQALGGIYSVVNQKRGQVIEEVQRPGTLLYNVKAYLPVIESFGFSIALRPATSGQAFPQ